MPRTPARLMAANSSAIEFWRSNERIAPDPTIRLQRSFGSIFVGRGVLPCDVLEREHLLDGGPVCALDIGVVVVVFRLSLRGPTDYLSLSIDLDLPAEFACFLLDAADLLYDPIECGDINRIVRCTGKCKAERPSRGEEGIAIA